MKIAVLTDIHANLPALRAALDEIALIGCDKIVHTGDLIGIGPHPRECMELMFERPDVLYVMGNHDAKFASGLPPVRPPQMSSRVYVHHRWTHEQLDPAMRDVVAEWPYAITKSCAGVRFAFQHYGWNVATQRFADVIDDPTASDLDRMFGGKNHDVVFYGHHHPKHEEQGLAHYINPGALGCSDEPVARFAVVELQGDGTYEISHHAAPYNPCVLFEAYEAREVPQREFFYENFFAGLFQSV